MKLINVNETKNLLNCNEIYTRAKLKNKVKFKVVLLKLKKKIVWIWNKYLYVYYLVSKIYKTLTVNETIHTNILKMNTR